MITLVRIAAFSFSFTLVFASQIRCCQCRFVSRQQCLLSLALHLPVRQGLLQRLRLRLLLLPLLQLVQQTVQHQHQTQLPPLHERQLRQPPQPKRRRLRGSIALSSQPRRRDERS